jgi:hypothetical protein
MIPISVTSQGDEIARGQSSADPLGRDSLDRGLVAAPRSTIGKRAARLKPNFYSNVLSQPPSRCGMLNFWATRSDLAPATTNRNAWLFPTKRSD